jgi:nucleoside-diphosphate-sugar epimerase
MEKTAKIYIAGHRGMVGSGLERKLRKKALIILLQEHQVS